MTVAFIALGSNIGQRTNNLDTSIGMIDAHYAVSILTKSKYLENPAIEGAGPHDFLNAVIKVETSLEAHALLDLILDIEKQIDPEREKRGRKAARIIDIDLLLHGEEKHNSERLTVPHPRMHERDFVMQPLLEIYPEYQVRKAGV